MADDTQRLANVNRLEFELKNTTKDQKGRLELQVFWKEGGPKRTTWPLTIRYRMTDAPSEKRFQAGCQRDLLFPSSLSKSGVSGRVCVRLHVQHTTACVESHHTSGEGREKCLYRRSDHIKNCCLQESWPGAQLVSRRRKLDRLQQRQSMDSRLSSRTAYARRRWQFTSFWRPLQSLFKRF